MGKMKLYFKKIFFCFTSIVEKKVKEFGRKLKLVMDKLTSLCYSNLLMRDNDSLKL
jgi:hypothetical protein